MEDRAKRRQSFRAGFRAGVPFAAAGFLLALSFGVVAIYPTFFLARLFAELRNGRARGVAAAGAVIALVLVPVAPPGLPVLAASVAAFAGLVRRGGRSSTAGASE